MRVKKRVLSFDERKAHGKPVCGFAVSWEPWGPGPEHHVSVPPGAGTWKRRGIMHAFFPLTRKGWADANELASEASEKNRGSMIRLTCTTKMKKWSSPYRAPSPWFQFTIVDCDKGSCIPWADDPDYYHGDE